MIFNNAKKWPLSLEKLIGIFLFVFAPLSIADEWDTAGHLKYYLSHSKYDSDNIFTLVGESSPVDQNLNFRFTADRKWLNNWDTVLHYEVAKFHSDSINVFRSLGPASALTGFGAPNDDRRLFNLTSVISDEDNNVLYHRLDRASIGYTTNNLVFRFGRQAVSWGNGMVFQPMDIFNPFSPTAVDKEYKTGDDMFYLQNLLESGDDIQTVLIPRRNVSTSNLAANQSSLAIKYHTTRGDTDLDFLLSRHYGNNILGIGFATDWLGTILRGDLINEWSSGDTRLSAVISINYSWMWVQHNVSGFAEYYHNGNGIDNSNYSATNLAKKPDLMDKLLRGETFTVGKDYISAGLTIELTPRWLFNLLLINNINDSSWLTQSTASFDWKEDLALMLGLNLPIGNRGTEYGGIETDIANVYSGGGNSFFLQLTYYY